MAQVIKFKRSETASAVPGTSDLEIGEVCMNIADKKLYTKDSGGNIVEISNTGISAETGASELVAVGSASTESMSILNI